MALGRPSGEDGRDPGMSKSSLVLSTIEPNDGATGSRGGEAGALTLIAGTTAGVCKMREGATAGAGTGTAGEGTGCLTFVLTFGAPAFEDEAADAAPVAETEDLGRDFFLDKGFPSLS